MSCVVLLVFRVGKNPALCEVKRYLRTLQGSQPELNNDLKRVFIKSKIIHITIAIAKGSLTVLYSMDVICLIRIVAEK